MQAARQDAGAIAESLNVRERSIRKVGEPQLRISTRVYMYTNTHARRTRTDLPPPLACHAYALFVCLKIPLSLTPLPRAHIRKHTCTRMHTLALCNACTHAQIHYILHYMKAAAFQGIYLFELQMEKSWELLATTVTAVEQRMQLLSDFSSQNVQHSAHLVAALQVSLSLSFPFVFLFPNIFSFSFSFLLSFSFPFWLSSTHCCSFSPNLSFIFSRSISFSLVLLFFANTCTHIHNVQARLGVLEPECQIFHSKLQELQSENQALKLAHNTRLESLQTVSQAQQQCLEVSLKNAKSSQVLSSLYPFLKIRHSHEGTHTAAPPPPHTHTHLHTTSLSCSLSLAWSLSCSLSLA